MRVLSAEQLDSVACSLRCSLAASRCTHSSPLVRFLKQMMRPPAQAEYDSGPRREGVPMVRRTLRTILFVSFSTLLIGLVFSWSTAAQSNPSDALKKLEFRELGPAVMGGRIDDVAVVESNPSVVYVGVASGGVWKTTNNGTTFEPVFDKEGVSTIGDIAIAPSDPSIIWVGTGEPNNRQSSSWGDGV